MSIAAIGFTPTPIGTEQKECASNPFRRVNWKRICSSLIQTKDFLASYLLAAEKWTSDSTASPLNGDSDETFPLSEDTDLEVIPDDAESQELHQIRKSDARYFLKLYESIDKGNTKMKIEGSPAFKKKILEYVKILLTRPKGRQLIGNICSMKRDVLIREGEKSEMVTCFDGNLMVYMNINSPTITKCQDSQGSVSLEPMPCFMIFAHELIHSLHQDALMAAPNGDWNFDQLYTLSTDPTFTNLSEQLTIAGVENEGPLLCENSLRAEFGMAARVTHIKSAFLSYTHEDLPDIDTPNEHGTTRLKNAVILKAYKEICTLLNAGANPGNGFTAAIRLNDSEMVQFLLEQGADPHKPDHTGMIPLHLAVLKDRRDIVKLLIEEGVRLVQHNASGQTALQLALENLHLYCALLLIHNGAPLTQKALECLAPEHHERFLTYVPPLMNWTDKRFGDSEPEEDASKKLPPKKRPASARSEAGAGADQPPKKRFRHRQPQSYPHPLLPDN